MVLPNRNEIHRIISNLLVERQKHSAVPTPSVTSSIDELKKFKDLLDQGIITQEEFDTKKKQILGL